MSVFKASAQLLKIWQHLPSIQKPSVYQVFTLFKCRWFDYCGVLWTLAGNYLNSRCGLEPCNFVVIDQVCVRPFANSLNCFVNHMERNKEPFRWFYWIPKAIFNVQVDLSFAEQAMEQVFHHSRVQVVKHLCSYYLNVCNQTY